MPGAPRAFTKLGCLATAQAAGTPTMLLLVLFLALLISSRSSPARPPRGRNWYYTVLCGLGEGGLRNLDWEIFLSK